MREKLRGLLEGREDTYRDFVNAIMRDMKDFPDGVEPLIKYIEEHPEANTGDILIFEQTLVDYEMADEDDEDESGEI